MMNKGKTKKRTFLNYDWSRVPVIKNEDTETMDKTYSYILHKLTTDAISVAELRLLCGLDVELIDYTVGFGKRALDYTGTNYGTEGIKFLPIHLQHFPNYGLELISLNKLKESDPELFSELAKAYPRIKPKNNDLDNKATFKLRSKKG